MKILVEVSNRHVHFSRRDINILFGKNHELKVLKKLSQPGEFAAKETVTLENKDNKIKNVRVLGPKRKQTQIELSKTDSEYLNINAPLRESRQLTATPGITITGPKGKIKLKKGVIRVKRHLHISNKEAKKLNLKNGQNVKIKVNGVIFDKIIVRVNPKYKLAVHLDTDEGNAAGINKKAFGELI